MRHGSLFSGIGGFDLAAQWMGWENVFHCEWNPFGQRLLKYYWPNAISYEDICATDFTVHRGSIDIVTGGFPCQPYSTAGKRLGKADERHLFPQMLRAIKEIKPRWVVGENVRGLVSWNGGLVFDEVCADLEGEGYEVIPFLIPAAGVNAPHRRDRVWFVAHARHDGDTRDAGKVSREAAQKNGRWTQSGTASGEQIQLPNESGALFGDAADAQKHGDRRNARAMGEKTSKPECEDEGSKFDGCNKIAPQNTIRDGCLRGEPIEEGAEIREQRDIGAKDSERICGEKMAGVAADSAGIRLEYGKKRGEVEDRSEEIRGTRSESTNAIETNGEVQHASDPMHEGLQRGQEVDGWKEYNTKWRGDRFNIRTNSKNFSRKSRSNFQRFPSVSPLCNGNDGLSDRLDGITFSKWRNESIKGGGNAVVVQIPYLIFKAIEAYETQTI